MTAGLNVRFDVFRMESVIDDEVGGAQVTGTLIYNRIPGRLTEENPELLVLQQGLETTKIFTARLLDQKPIGMDIRERDELEIIEPYNHYYKDDRFRVIGTPRVSIHPSDRRATLRMNVTRSVRAHANQ